MAQHLPAGASPLGDGGREAGAFREIAGFLAEAIEFGGAEGGDLGKLGVDVGEGAQRWFAGTVDASGGEGAGLGQDLAGDRAGRYPHPNRGGIGRVDLRRELGASGQHQGERPGPVGIGQGIPLFAFLGGSDDVGPQVAAASSHQNEWFAALSLFGGVDQVGGRGQGGQGGHGVGGKADEGVAGDRPINQVSKGNVGHGKLVV